MRKMASSICGPERIKFDIDIPSGFRTANHLVERSIGAWNVFETVNRYYEVKKVVFENEVCRIAIEEVEPIKVQVERSFLEFLSNIAEELTFPASRVGNNIGRIDLSKVLRHEASMHPVSCA